MSPMPNWLVRALIAQGKLDPDGVRRNARMQRCPHCQAVVVRGLDDDRCAAPVSVDPQPLSVLGELAALMSDRWTYHLTPFGSGELRIDRRSHFEIRGSPVGTTRGDVVAEHRCHAPPLDSLDSRIPAPLPRATYHDEPPF